MFALLDCRLPAKHLQRFCTLFLLWQGAIPAMSWAAEPSTVPAIKQQASESQRIERSRTIGAPSYRMIVAPSARLETSQFHIIHPQVVT